MTLSQEPVLIMGTVLAVLNALQLAALGLPAWTHTVIGVSSIVIGTVLARSQVSPKQ